MRINAKALNKNYSKIVNQCRENNETIFLTKDNKDDLVLMSLDNYNKRQALIKLKERLLDIEEDQINGAKFYSLDELKFALKIIISKSRNIM